MITFENTKQTIGSRLKEIGLSESDVKKEISYAVQIINGSKSLSSCEPNSILSAITNVAQIGLTLNPVHKLCYLVQSYDRVRNTQICRAEPSYQGLIKLLTDSGSVNFVMAQVVYEFDYFKVDATNFEKPIEHRPDPFDPNRGVMMGVYAIGVMPDGNKLYETMSIEEIDTIMNRSDGYKSYKDGRIKTCPWVTDKSEMSRKTVIRRLAKYLPKTNRFDRVAEAIHLDEVDYTASDSQKQYAYSLLENCSIVDRIELASISQEIEDGRNIDAVIEKLKDNQIENSRKSMTEVGKMVDEKVNDDRS